MSKRDKALVILGVIVLAVVCFAMLQRPNEPKYQGRYLSEWMAMYSRGGEQVVKAKRAIQAIGTNALPCYVRWIRYEPVEWRTSLYEKRPSWMPGKAMVERWLVGPDLRAGYAVSGIWFLETNAASAIPDLTMIMRDGTKPRAAGNASIALAGIGEHAIPALKAAFADTNQVSRGNIVRAFELLVGDGHTNACLPILIESLNDPDADVRWDATNAIQKIAPHLLTNTPAL